MVQIQILTTMKMTSKWIKKYTVDGGTSVFGYTPTIVDYLKKEYPEEYEEQLGIGTICW